MTTGVAARATRVRWRTPSESTWTKVRSNLRPDRGRTWLGSAGRGSGRRHFRQQPSASSRRLPAFASQPWLRAPWPAARGPRRGRCRWRCPLHEHPPAAHGYRLWFPVDVRDRRKCTRWSSRRSRGPRAWMPRCLRRHRVSAARRCWPKPGKSTPSSAAACLRALRTPESHIGFDASVSCGKTHAFGSFFSSFAMCHSKSAVRSPSASIRLLPGVFGTLMSPCQLRCSMLIVPSIKSTWRSCRPIASEIRVPVVTQISQISK